MEPHVAPCEVLLIPSGNPRRPLFQSTISSPPLSPTPLSETLQELSSLKINTQLATPNCPGLDGSNNDFEPSNNPAYRRKASVISSQTRCEFVPGEEYVEGEDIPLIIECPFEVQIVRDSSNRPQMFGQGAWSKVYRATKAVSPAFSPTDILTPPPSPQTSGPLLVAIKAPLSHASRPVLRNEAITLSRLSRTPHHENFIIPFYGYLPSSASLVLASVPMSLSNHVMARSRLAHANDPNPNSADPIIGSTSTWLSLAARLITALTWLHNTAGVVHGDIKPGNILLSPNRSSSDSFAFDPVLIDFSSSHFLSSTVSAPNTLSALTREYTAPELLSPSVLRDPATTATTASDVFSLGVTLTVAATGELTVYHGTLWQRQHFATQGWNILEFARHGDASTRLPRDGVVERVVEPAVRKADQGRIEAARWTHLVATLQE